MGSAADRRGAAAVRASLEAEQRNDCFRLIADLNTLEKFPHAQHPFGALRLVYDAAHQVWWLQDAVKEDAGLGFYSTSLRELVRSWHLVVTGYDATTHVWSAVPCGRGPHAL